MIKNCNVHLSECDLKLIKAIEKKINSFEQDKLSLHELVSDLEGFMTVVESIAAAWKEEFRMQVNNLELISDSIKDGSISRWNGNFKLDLSKSLSQMKMLINTLLSGYLKISDPNILEVATVADSNWLICPSCNDAWECASSSAMVICPKCERAYHNPRARNQLKR